MAFSKDNQPARTGNSETALAVPSKRKSKLLGGLTARSGGEAVIVAAVLAVVAFWQGDLLSGSLDMYMDDGKAWPVDGVLAVLTGIYCAFSKRVKLVNKIRFVPGLVVYGANSIYSAREAAGLSTP